MCENNAANSGNAVIANPELGPSGLSVETLHGTPRTGEEKVRPGGNKNRQRQAEMTCPLDRWSVEFHTLQLSMDFPHTLLGSFGQMSATRTGQIQELVYQVEGGKTPIGHLDVSEDSEDLTYPVLAGLSPHPLGGTNVPLSIQGAIHDGPCTVVDGAAQMSLNVSQDGFIVVPLGDDDVSGEVASFHGASFGLIGTGVLKDPDSTIGPEEASEFGFPFYPIIYGTAPIGNACVEIRIGAEAEVEPFSIHAPSIPPF